ncbi:DUF4097 family beta strand repeat-containing protein [Pendulispora albinea]|uniref:DUF4097 domain-containing protein n=1 Tax=Pendulispora albinea TaxID=2741071 RepID=A0ABZ2LMF9_9BACT
MNRWLWTMTVAATVSTALGCSETTPVRPAHAGSADAPVSLSSGTAGGDFHYEKAIVPPKSLEIRGVNGNVRALGTPSGTVEVRATKKAERGDPASQRVVVAEHDAGVVICALSANQPDSDCKPADESDYAPRGTNSSGADVKVDFEVRVPAGVPFIARTLNGDIEAKEMRGQVRLLTLNGDVDVSTTGRLVAKTLNGRIVAPLASGVKVPVQLEAVNGSIELRAPEDASFDLNATTVSGHIASDFAIPAGRAGGGLPETVSAKVGSGGARVALKTVSGDITVKRLR